MVPSQEAVAARAHEMWEEAGCPPGPAQAQKFWFLAEEELESRDYAMRGNRPIPDRAENDAPSRARGAPPAGERN